MRKLFLVTTAACNFACHYCYRFMPKGRHLQLSTTESIRLITEAFALGFKGLALTGGEPLLRRDIFEIIGAAKDIGYENISMNSNGAFISSDMVDLLNTSGLHTINISVDSFDKTYTDDVGRDFDALTQGIKNLSHLQPRKIKVRVTIVATKRNFRDLQATIRFFRSLGVNDFFIQPLALPKGSPAYEELSFETLSADEMGHLSRELGALAKILHQEKYMQFILDYYSKREIKIDRCAAYINTVMVESNGDVYNCFGKSMEVLGNIRTEPLSQILQRKNNEEMVKAKCINSKCLCFFKSSLRGAYD